MQEGRNIVANNLDALSKLMLYSLTAVGLLFCIIDYHRTGISVYFVTQSAMVLPLLVFAIYDKFRPNYRIRNIFMLAIGVTMLPLRYYAFQQVVAPTLMWFLLIPTLATVFFSVRVAKLFFVITCIEVAIVCFLVKIKSFNPIEFEAFTITESNMLLGWFFLQFVLSWYFMNLEKIKDKYFDLIQKRLAHDKNISRLTAMGEIAGATAHEITSPLQVISGFLIIIEQKLKEKDLANIDEVYELINKCQNTVSQISGVTKSMLKLSYKGDTSQLEKADVFDSLKMAINVMDYQLQIENIELIYNEQELRFQTFINSAALAHVFLNLMSNSKYAVKTLPEKWIRIKGERGEDNFTVYIHDSGPGIPKKIAKNIFDPFFTTKPEGEGTGFGLSVSQSLLSQMNADLEFCPEQKNTCFKIVFHLDDL